MFSEYNKYEVEINNREDKRIIQAIWKLNSRLLNNLLGKRRSLREN